MRILIVTIPLPTATRPNTMTPLVYQIESLRALGIQVDVLEIIGVSKLKYLQYLPTLYQRMAHTDLIHAHYGYCGWLARAQFSKPVVVSFMGSDILGSPNAQGKIRPFSKLVVRLDRWLAGMVDAVIVKSAEMAEVVKPVKSYIIPNGVDLQAYSPMDRSQAKAKLGWAEDKRYILFAGNPDDSRKGFPLAQAAVSGAIQTMGEPLQLVPLRGVAVKTVPLYMNACEAMLMTSFIEGSPNVVKEAMACNLPVVSVPVGDTCELLNGAVGYTVCPRDPQLLAEALVKTLNNRQPVEGRTALKRKGLSLDSVAHKIQAIYEEVLA